jgi:hypothetical protein
MTLLIISGVVLGLSLFVETFGFFLRSAGSSMALSSLGYSLHVQLATISRLGTFIGMPLVGFLLDSGTDPKTVSILPLMVSGIFIVCAVITLYYSTGVERFSVWLFLFLGRKISKLDVPCNGKRASPTEISTSEEAMLFWLSFLSHIIIVVGFYLMIILASIFNDWRVTLMQSTPLLTAAGTLISVIYFDPRASTLIDKSINPFRVTHIIMRARCSSMASILLISGLLSVFLHV